MPIRALVIVLLALAALASTAHAAGGETLEGKTDTWDDISLSLAESGAPISWKVEPLPVNCKKAVLNTRKLTIRDFDETSPTEFSDVSKMKERYGRYTVRSTLTLTGELGEINWGGEFWRVSTVMRKGRAIDTCKLGAYWHTLPD